MRVVSVFARHEPFTAVQLYVLSFHGIWALLCWVAFVAQWLLPKGTISHQQRGFILFWIFLFPLEATGLFLTPYLLSNIPRSNIIMSSGYLVVPTMGFHFFLTSFRAFPFLRKKWMEPLLRGLGGVNFILQCIGCSVLAYKVLWHVEHGMQHQNNIELLALTTPFTAMQGTLMFRPHLKALGHPFYIKYLTLQMFPGTMIVLSRDKYWLWGPQGLNNLHIRMLIEFVPMVPFFIMVWPTLLATRKANKVA